MLGGDFFDFFARKEGEDLKVFDNFCVVRIVKVLVNLVGAGLCLVKPKRVSFALSKFLSAGVKNQGHRKCVGLLVEHFSDKVHACGDVAPLVASGHLHYAVFFLEKVDKVKALQKHVGEFGKGYASLQAAADYVLVQHVVKADVFSNVAQGVQKGAVLPPVVVVHQFRSGNERLDLRADSVDVGVDGFFADDFALGCGARVSDAAGRAAAQKNRMMAGVGQTLCHAQR